MSEREAYYQPLTRVSPHTTIRRERLLPIPGEVLVKIGDRVEPVDPVAQTSLPAGLRVVNAARVLGVAPGKVPQHLLKEVGETVEAKEPLIFKRWLFGLYRRTYGSPVSGTLVAVEEGELLLERAAVPFELSACLKGMVINIMPRFGAVIETTGALIQGIWGTDKEAWGVIRLLTEEPNQPLSPDLIDVGCHGTIIMGSLVVEAETLRRAEGAQVRGLILGGIEPDLMDIARALPFPVIVTDGIGPVPMSTPIFELLREKNGQEASIKGTTKVRWEGLRPEIVIPVYRREDEEGPPVAPDTAPLVEGSQVRIAAGPNIGATGQVRALPTRTRPVGSGVRVKVAEVELDRGGRVLVPLANLELLG
ncbi:MAG: hypothetical protein ACE5NP_10400 [Anaerolineae bacterium]